MAQVELKYHDGTIVWRLPDEAAIDSFAPRNAEYMIGFEDLQAELRRVDGHRCLHTQDPLIVVNDAYRSTPTPKILDWIDQIESGVLDRAGFLVATGTHPAPTESQLELIFGHHLNRIDHRYSVHDCRDKDSLEQVGVDGFGRPVMLNRTVLRASRVIVIGSVEPHYFAGYTGGRKSLFPGLTDFATVERNHNLACSLDCRPLRLGGNPVAEHLEQLLEFVESVSFLSFQTVLDANSNLAGICCGDLGDSFRRATSIADAVYANRVALPYDLVIAEMQPPLDANLYQLQKALENCQAAVRDGGAIILVSSCREGVGSSAFFDQADGWDRKANRPRDGILRFGCHKLSRVAETANRIGVYVYSELHDNDVRRVFYEPLDKTEPIEFISRSNSAALRVAVVHDAGNTVLTI